MRPIVSCSLLLSVVFLISGWSSAGATGAGDFDSKPPLQPLPQPRREACPPLLIAHDWDFSVGSQGFGSYPCDGSGSDPWQWGHADIPGAPAMVWGTILESDYPNESGAGLRSPYFLVDAASNRVEVQHYFETEYGYDGCNLVVYPHGLVLEPVGGYTVPAISPSGSYYAWCVDGEPGWTGSSGGWRVDCFDVSAFAGQQIAIELDFGSDASVTAMGWYVSRVRVGAPAAATAPCCLPDGTCQMLTQAACLAAGGTWVSEIQWCYPGLCGSSAAACCLSDGTCQVLQQAECEGLGGTWLSGSPVCAPDPCPPPSPPAAPRNLLAETQGTDRIGLSWEDDSALEESFIIERKDGASGSWEVVQILPGNAISWEDLGVQDGHSYYYRVRGTNETGESPFSNFAGAQAGPVPAAPTNVVATPISPVKATLTWVDQAGNEIGFQIQWKVGEFGSWGTVQATLPANSGSTPLLGLAPSMRYTFRIRAYNQYGSSAWVTSSDCIMPPDPGNFSATIHVARGTQQIAGARIYRNRTGVDFVYLGDTNSSGDFVIPDLALNDRIRAVWEAKKWQTCREYTEDIPDLDFGMQLVFDTDERLANAHYRPFPVETVATDYYLDLQHPAFHIDLAMSIEWDVPQGGVFWDRLSAGCRQAASYLYDVTDGQMVLGKVVVWDCKGWWADADVRIETHLAVPHSDLGQLLDCDDYSTEEHMFLSGQTGHHPLPDPVWSSTMIHELGHYVLNLKDEYETPLGGTAGMDALKKTQPWTYPMNFGFMDWQGGTDEMSSANDYLQNFVYECVGYELPGYCQTEQLYSRGKPCWDQVEQDLEGWSSLVDIQKPPYGWFASGASTSSDLAGPNEGFILDYFGYGDLGSVAGPEPEIRIMDRGPGSFTSSVEVVGPRGPIADAQVYKLGGGSLVDLGRTDLRGRLEAVGLYDGDVLRTFVRDEYGTSRVLSEPLGARAGEVVPLRMNLREKSDRPRPSAGSAGSQLDDGTAPGAAFDLTPLSNGESVTLTLELWSDESLVALPSVVAFCAGSIDTLAVHAFPDPEHYWASIDVAPAGTSFDGTGTFEAAMEDLFANRTDLVIPFHLDELQANESAEIYQGFADFNLSAASVTASLPAAAAAGNPYPFRVPGEEAVPVGDIFSFALQQTEPYPAPGSMNIQYNDSLLAGIDERSLRIRRWDPSGPAWVPLGEQGVSTAHNVVSATVSEGGTFCIFADSVAADAIAPGAVTDFGAVGSPGGGAIQLFWTATGDDGDVGAAENYMVAWSDSAFDAAEWEALPMVPLDAGGPAGTELNAMLRLPMEGHLYYLAVRAIDEASNLSAVSNVTYAISGVADANLLPAPPSDFRAVDSPGDAGGVVRLTWERSYDDGGGKNTVTGYQVYRAEPSLLVPQPIGFRPAGDTTFTDSTATTARRFVYWVSATDGEAQTMAAENRAYSAQNLGAPTGDFNSDAIVGVDDLALLLEGYGLPAADLEFDPLLDLDGDAHIFEGDAAIFREGFGSGGLPASDPPGENAGATLLREEVFGGGSLWHLNITIRDAYNLSGYSFRVEYPEESLAFLGAIPDSEGVIPNMLNEEGGTTPVFLIREVEPGRILLANAMQRPSAWLAPDGDGFVARLTFLGSGIGNVEVRDIVLMDHERRLNFHASASAVEDGETVLRPRLHGAQPSPSSGPMAIRFQVPSRRKVTLAVYDVGGRLVRTLLNSSVPPGTHEIVWDGTSNQKRRLASGVYFLRMESEEFRASRKIVRVR